MSDLQDIIDECEAAEVGFADDVDLFVLQEAVDRIKELEQQVASLQAALAADPLSEDEIDSEMHRQLLPATADKEQER